MEKGLLEIASAVAYTYSISLTLDAHLDLGPEGVEELHVLELDRARVQHRGAVALGLQALDEALAVHQLEHVVARHLGLRGVAHHHRRLPRAHARVEDAHEGHHHLRAVSRGCGAVSRGSLERKGSIETADFLGSTWFHLKFMALHLIFKARRLPGSPQSPL